MASGQSYLRPLPILATVTAADMPRLAGGWCHFSHVERLIRGGSPEIISVNDLSSTELAPLTAPRPIFAGLSLNLPRLMGILNITPDSFSDGGLFLRPEAAMMAARTMATKADILDIGGESTRPGAQEVAIEEEIARTQPVIAAMRAAGITRPISIDTRKADVARAALAAGAHIVNDVSALRFDPNMAKAVSESQAPVILMHALKTPDTMQDDPHYEDVLLDVYDALATRVAEAEAAGISRSRIAIDPGIGFGKTLAHNLALLARLSLFHGLGLPILLGASRKRFIGTISGEEDAKRRMPGSLAVALAGVAQGAQIIRVHDVSEMRQALSLWQAVTQTGKE